MRLAKVEYIGEFHISGIRTTVQRFARNAILRRTQVDELTFEILDHVDTALPNLRRDLSFLPEEHMSLSKRIDNRRDIACLDLFYDDGSSDEFYLPRDFDEDGCRNKRLSIRSGNKGSLIVSLQR